MMTTSFGAIHIEGTSGKTYDFQAFPYDTPFDRVGAVFFVTHRSSVGGRTAHTRIYCGETSDLSGHRFSDDQERAFRSHGANCICIHLIEDPGERRAIEKDIHGNYTLLCPELPG